MKKLAQALLLFSLLFNAFSQEALKSAEEEYYDFLSLQGMTERPTLNYRTLSDSEWQINAESHPWEDNNLGTKTVLFEPDYINENTFMRGINQSISLKLYGPEWFNSYNTHVPYGQNDGALWQGKGYNSSLTLGARFEGYGVELTFKPQITFSQNASFNYLPGVYGSEYSYFWSGNIDLVQRYGSSSYWQFDFGDTEIRYTWHTLTAGFGTQSPWIGPAWLNPMLGSNNSGTYPKVDLGLRRTRVTIPGIKWYAGDIEARVWVGYLSESDYFDNNSDNDTRQLTGWAVSYAPSFLPGLSVGINKICINYWDDFSLKYLNPFYSENGGWYNNNAQEDQKMSFFADWIFPQIGFEVYGEIGKDDYSANNKANPFHTCIYTVGAKKTLPIVKSKRIYSEIIFEWSNFEMSQDFQLQWGYMGYYAHGGVKQGYTQNGQIIGAGSGYFGNSQFIGFNVYFPKGSAMIFFHRSNPDNNYIYNMSITKGTSDWGGQHEYWAKYRTYNTFGLCGQFFVTEDLRLYGEADLIHIEYFEYYQDGDSNSNSFRFCFGLKYTF